LHAKTWKELGHHVEIWDVLKNTTPLIDVLKTYEPDVVDFCDTPKSRIEYLTKYYEHFEDKEIYLEKPPCRLQDVDTYEELCSKLNITPIHNYLFMDLPKHVMKIQSWKCMTNYLMN